MDVWAGSPPPTSATPRSLERPTFAADVVELAGILGVQPMGWQVLTLERALEHVDGRPVFREVDLSIARQSGKSTLILLVVLHKMLRTPGSWATYTSASRLAARRKLLRVWWPLIARSPLGPMFKLIRVNGSESLECSNGSTFLILSGEESSGLGDSLDLAVLDEVWSLSEAAEQAVRPAMAARRDAQLWCVSTAGTPRSVFWRDKVDRGRQLAADGMTEGTCFVEWAARPGIDLTDESLWPEYMPALGRTIQPETVAADLRSMPITEWSRAYANRWDDENELGGWAVISEDTWQASAL
jgi:phage terminase large subunit-like protein